MYELSLKGKYDDSLKSKIYGTSKSYCYNNSCKFKNIRGKCLILIYLLIY